MVFITGFVNTQFDVDFNFFSTNTIKCKFMYNTRSSWKLCALEYGPKVAGQCNRALPLLSRRNISSSVRSDTVEVQLHSSIQLGVVYCYRLTASDETGTATVVGIFTG